MAFHGNLISVKYSLRIVIVGCIVTLLTACGAIPSSRWVNLEDGLERAVFPYANRDEMHEIAVYKIDQSKYTFEVHNAPKPKSLSMWSKDTGADIVVNGGYFHPDFLPSGFLVSDGEVVGTRAFDLDKSGLISIQNGKLDIVDLDVSPEKVNETFEHALQSYPFFIKQGKPSIKKDSGKIGRRTAIAIDNDDNVYLIMVPYGDLSLYKLMEEILDMDVSFRYVLNLDGGTSTAMVVNTGSYQEQIHEKMAVPNVIVVKARSE